MQGFLYKNLLRPVLFQIDSEKIHNLFLRFGENAGKFYRVSPNFDPRLCQTLTGISFPSPVGLAAGFDYEARLTQLLPALGFGFETVGTITNLPYEGNPRPRLGRLPKSKSLMVNKGFKNLGAKATIEKLSALRFTIPLGVSIGTRESVSDLVSAFIKFEKASLPHSYYELNISCPNIKNGPNFYIPKNLKTLLAELDKLKISKPVFVKMPISEPNKKFLCLLDVIANFSPKGVILGNLQKDRKTLDPSERELYSIGNFSGRPTFKRSNELIAKAYKIYRDRFVIIGCGGIFSATDAYEKILCGASAVQLITGLVFEGPQLVSEINRGLRELLARDGLQNISQAIGSRLKSPRGREE